jgi:hypothetical protein
MQGDQHRSIEYDSYILRDLRSTRAIRPFGDPRLTVAQCDIGAYQERSGPAD